MPPLEQQTGGLLALGSWLLAVAVIVATVLGLLWLIGPTT